MLQGVGFRCYLPKSLSVRNMPEPLVGSSMQLKAVGLALGPQPTSAIGIMVHSLNPKPLNPKPETLNPKP